MKKKEKGVRIGPLRHPVRDLVGHLAVVGRPGASKTLTMQNVLWDAITELERAYVYDHKVEYVGWLHGAAPPDMPIHILHPLDARSVAPDWAKDVNTPLRCQQVAEALVPKEVGETVPYFRNAARILLVEVLEWLMRRYIMYGVPWTFRDVLNLTKYLGRIRYTFRSDPHSERVVDQHLSNEDSANNVLTTLGTCLAPLKIIAASWEYATELISMVESTHERGLYVIPNIEQSKNATGKLLEVWMRLLSDEILTPPYDRGMTLFVFDEMRALTKGVDLMPIATRGRASSASLWLGLQSAAGGIEAIGKNAMDELFDVLQLLIALRVEGHTTAKFISDHCGDQDVLETSHNESRSRDGVTRSINHSIHNRPTILPGEVMDLRPYDWERDEAHAVIKTPRTGPYFARYGVRETAERAAALNDCPNFVKRPAAHQQLTDMRPEDWRRLRLPPMKED